MVVSTTPSEEYLSYGNEFQDVTITNGTSSRSGDNLHTALKVIQSLIFVFALGGNIVTIGVLLLYRKSRRKFSRMNLFILHLCIADIAVALFNVAPNLCFIVSYPEPCPVQNSTQTCKAVNYFSLVAIYGSTYVLVTTAIDRFIAICYPFTAQRLENRHVHLMACAAWIISFVFSIPQILIFDFNEPSQMCNVIWHNETDKNKHYSDVYMGWFACAVWIFPTIIIAVCYISIIAMVWNRSGALLRRSTVSSNKTKSLRKSQSDSHTTAQSRLMKPVKLTLMVIIGYIWCWSPWMISMMMLQYRKETEPLSAPVMVVVELMTYLIGLNSCLNPWLYLCFNCGALRASRMKRQYTTYTTQTIPDAGHLTRQHSDTPDVTMLTITGNNEESLDKISNL